MNQVNQVLDERSKRFGKRPLRLALSLSAFIHVGMVLLFIFVPSLLRSDPPRIEYVEVVSIPAADLKQGPRPEPKKEAPAPKPPREPDVAPEIPVEVPEDIPVLEPDKEDPPPKPKEPEPVDVPEDAPEPDEIDDDPSAALPEEPSLPSASKGEVKDTTIAGFDDPDFKYDYYTQRLIQAIRRTWRRPKLDRRMDLAIKFRVAKDGTVSDVEVVRTSGIPSYDRTGIRALQDASPLPPLPVAYRKTSLGVTLLLP